MVRRAVLIWIGCLAAGCGGGEDQFEQVTVAKTAVQESAPSRLPSCTADPSPQVTIVPVSRAPLRLILKRAYHVCLGEYAVLLELKATSTRRITQIVIQREWQDVRGHRAPRRDYFPWARSFQRRTVRYLRFRWREGRTNPGERRLRLRLHRVHFADGGHWEAPRWPQTPSTPAKPDGGQSLQDRVNRVRHRIQDATRQIRKIGMRIQRVADDLRPKNDPPNKKP